MLCANIENESQNQGSPRVSERDSAFCSLYRMFVIESRMWPSKGFVKFEKTDHIIMTYKKGGTRASQLSRNSAL